MDRETGTIRFANAAADRFAGGVFPKDLCHDLLKSAAQGTQLASREARLHLNGVTVPVVLSSSPWSSGVVVTIQDDRGAERVKTRFLSNVSHEFRTPLNAIVGFSELLLGETKRGTLKHKYMQAIRRNGERLSRLISDVLEVSKIDEKESDFGEEPLVPRTMCQAILDEYQDLAREKNLRLQARFDGPCDDASLSDPRRLRRVLTSLLDNALKFTARGFVQLETRVANGRVEFRVSDSGAGIPERLREELFKPFSQADGSSTRRFGGSGLGLELARKTARTMGGDVLLEISAPGKGSRFLFWMPAKPAPVSKARPVPPV
ncbi:MAG: HAMP domain-containing sensor histidine kinase, partial [Bdellovibrionia bacterium]